MMDYQPSNSELWFLCDLLNRPVVDHDGRTLGRVADLAADVREPEPPVTGVILSEGRKPKRFLPWTLVAGLEGKALQVKAGAGDSLTAPLNPDGEILLKKTLLDKQIVDTAGAKVVRVNDVQLRQKQDGLVLSKVDVGLRGLLRRVGLHTVMASILKWLFGYDLMDSLITWRLVQSVGSSDVLRLNLSQSRLARLHPADLADILENLDRPEQVRVFNALDVDVAAEVLEEADPKIQVMLIQNLSTEEASDVIEQMSPSAATDLLQELEEPQAQTILEEMEPEAAEDVRCLLSHDEETAGGIMTTSFFTQPPCVTVEEALMALRREAIDLDVIYYVYVEDQHGHLLGALNLRDLLTADPQETLDAIMVPRVVSCPLDAELDEVADLFAKYGLRAIPVVDESNRIHGVIRFKALLEAVAPHLG